MRVPAYQRLHTESRHFLHVNDGRMPAKSSLSQLVNEGLLRVSKRSVNLVSGTTALCVHYRLLAGNIENRNRRWNSRHRELERLQL